MASVYYLYDDALNTEEEIVKKYKGWLVRYHLPDILHEYYDRVNLNWYNRMATKIQALYKGYTVRKEICIKEILANRAKINAANAEIEKALKEQMKKNYVLRHKVHVEKIFTALFDRHHLLRTQRTEGALSTHDTQELSYLETFLRAMECKPYMDKLREVYYTFNKEKQEEERKNKKKYSSFQEDKACLRKVPKEWLEKRDQKDKNPFILPRKIDDKPYERTLTGTEKYTGFPKPLVRTEDASKNISDTDFNLYSLKDVANELDVPPYYIDIWFEKCRIHNIP